MKNLQAHERNLIHLADGRILDQDDLRWNELRRRAQSMNPHREVKTEWCERFIISLFAKEPEWATCMRHGYLFEMAEAAGLYRVGGDNTAMTAAIHKLLDVDCDDGYFYFRLRKAA